MQEAAKAAHATLTGGGASGTGEETCSARMARKPATGPRDDRPNPADGSIEGTAQKIMSGASSSDSAAPASVLSDGMQQPGLTGCGGVESKDEPSENESKGKGAEEHDEGKGKGAEEQARLTAKGKTKVEGKGAEEHDEGKGKGAEEQVQAGLTAKGRTKGEDKGEKKGKTRKGQGARRKQIRLVPGTGRVRARTGVAAVAQVQALILVFGEHPGDRLAEVEKAHVGAASGQGVGQNLPPRA
jgi:hypothetical protein